MRHSCSIFKFFCFCFFSYRQRASFTCLRRHAQRTNLCYISILLCVIVMYYWCRLLLMLLEVGAPLQGTCLNRCVRSKLIAVVYGSLNPKKNAWCYSMHLYIRKALAINCMCDWEPVCYAFALSQVVRPVTGSSFMHSVTWKWSSSTRWLVNPHLLNPALLTSEAWASEGGGKGVALAPLDFEIFRNKGLFSWFRVGKNKFHHFCPPPWKNLEKSLSARRATRGGGNCPPRNFQNIA